MADNDKQNIDQNTRSGVPNPEGSNESADENKSGNLDQADIARILAEMKENSKGDEGTVGEGADESVKEQSGSMDQDGDSGGKDENSVVDQEPVEKADEESESVKSESMEQDGDSSGTKKDEFVMGHEDMNSEKESTQKENLHDQESGDPGERDNAALKEIKKPGKNKKMIQLGLGICCLFLVCGMIWFGFHVLNQTSDKKTGHMEKEAQVEIISPNAAVNQDEMKNSDFPDRASNSLEKRLGQKLIEIIQLREQLLMKEGEVSELKHHYKFAVDQVKEEILKEKNRLNITSFQQAIQNKSLELHLNTIQRRQAYIQSLKKPMIWLDYGSEELLYTNRKFDIDRKIIHIVDHMNLEQMIQECDSIMKKYILSSDKLAIHMENTQANPLEKIWLKVVEKERPAILSKLNPMNHKTLQNQDETKRNQIIWDEICDGNHSRKGILTALSINAAKCLSRSREKDLFLNQISIMTPSSARHLFKWKGDWICMNGLEKLSPDTARHMFQWTGKWISMNRISKISFDSLMYLLNWKGKKLELMGLKTGEMQNDPLAVKYLFQWEKAGGKLYISDDLREFFNQRIKN